MKKTLSLRPPEDREDAPKLQRKGRGWNIAESRLDAIHELAREKRRNPSPAQAALAAELTHEDLGQYKPKAFTVIGSAIANFGCLPLKLVVLIDEGDVSAEIEHRRDKSLTEVGIQVVRYTAEEVLADPARVARETVAAMKARYEDLRAQSRPARPAARSYGAPRR
jgi:very-short-patch-repair endonuclease